MLSHILFYVLVSPPWFTEFFNKFFENMLTNSSPTLWHTQLISNIVIHVAV